MRRALTAAGPDAIRRVPLVLALLLLVLTLAGCGASSGSGGAAGSADSEEPGAIHVHGLGIDPADRAVLVATHTGLFRLAEGERAASRVGDSTQDMMGFAVTGPHRYLASGHPELPTHQAPLLGLISTADGGLTWTPVSESGRADFHILRASGTSVVGWDSGSGRLFVSDDSGRRWTQRAAPGDLVDIALHPGRDGAFLASTQRGILSTEDGGASWRTLGAGPGLLAWPTPDALFRVGPDGDVSVSGDGGRTWTARSSVDGPPAALAADGPQRLVLAMHDGAVLESVDAGASWRDLTTLR